MAKSSKDYNEVLGLARRSLSGYAPLIYPRFEVAWHHSKLISKLEAVERGELKRLMVFMPPRHGKSLLSTQIFPAWYLGRNPDRSIITATYSQDLSDDFGRNVRNFVNDPYTAAVFPELRISEDSNSMKRFTTSGGGAYYAVGRGAAITGRGAHLSADRRSNQGHGRSAQRERQAHASRLVFERCVYSSAARRRRGHHPDALAP